MSRSSRSCDVAVVGGGVIGLAIAWRAARRGLSVIVVERGQAGGGTSRVAAGMLAPITEANPAEQDLLGLGLRSAATYPAFVAELTEASRRDPGYLECGSLVAARDADEAEALVRELDMRRGLGLPVQRLRPTEARALEPALAPVLRLGLAVPDDHVIDPRRLTAALVDGLRLAGGELVASTTVSSVIVAQGRVAGIALADGQAIDASHVVLAAGAWSPELGGLDADARIPIRPVKGQILFMHDPAGPGLLTRVLRMAGGYIVPRGDGRYVLGATMEERGFDTTVTAGAMFSLLRDAAELLPGVSELVIDELCAGLRPASPDSAPVIGPGAVSGLHWATGHYRNGILLAPITADVVLDGILAQDGPPDWAAPFSPRRFAGVTVGA